MTEHVKDATIDRAHRERTKERFADDLIKLIKDFVSFVFFRESFDKGNHKHMWKRLGKIRCNNELM